MKYTYGVPAKQILCKLCKNCWSGNVTNDGRHYCTQCLNWLERNEPDFALGIYQVDYKLTTYVGGAILDTTRIIDGFL